VSVGIGHHAGFPFLNTFFCVYSYQMESKYSNKSVAEILRNISAVYQIQGANQFQIRAYDLAADNTRSLGARKAW
jgi:hypothetical protein